MFSMDDAFFLFESKETQFGKEIQDCDKLEINFVDVCNLNLSVSSQEITFEKVTDKAVVKSHIKYVYNHNRSILLNSLGQILEI